MPTNPILATNDASILLGRIHTDFPDLAWQKYKFIQAGWDHEVIQLDNQYIFRFPNSPEYREALRHEVALMSYLDKHLSVRMPRYKYVAKDFSFGGYTMIAGEELSAEKYETMSSEQRQKAAQDIATFLSELHAINVSDLDDFNIVHEPNFAGYADVTAEAEKYLKPNMSPDNFQAVTKMLEYISPFKKQSHPARLIHDDIAPKHLIWDAASEKLGFIDFSDRAISDPAYDFAELYTYGEDFVDMVYASYTGPDKDTQFLPRAKAYMKAIGIHSLANSYRTEKMSRKEGLGLFEIGVKLLD